MDLGGPPGANPSGRLPTPLAGVGGTREMGFAAFSNGGEEAFFNGVTFLKRKNPRFRAEKTAHFFR
jgi:hypothetical protein